MKYGLLSAAGVIAAAVLAPAASAAVFTPADPNFTVVGDISSGPITAYFGNGGLDGFFTDEFRFTIDQTGTGSGTVTTNTSAIGSSTDVDLFSVFVNGIPVPKTIDDGSTEQFSLTSIPIFYGQLNTITINGFARGAGGYSGTATFLPIPEPGTWALMIAGFGLVGFAMRKQRTAIKTSVA